ncbi:MAG: cbb3-type cytochrome c oxidase subunit I [Ideonella sp.]|nr:cbb3-type cytochrome c oxidase subunit I [Ideonella sp.]MCC7458820.1 cbb3-type cytochrome c oxidase subunit I [Nitrospira sp.]
MSRGRAHGTATDAMRAAAAPRGVIDPATPQSPRAFDPTAQPRRTFAWPAHRYELAVPAGERRVLALSWLALATAALIGSGLFALLLVGARTPGVNALLPGVDFFHVALVVHVDLSVLVWFLAMAGVLWTLAGSERWLALGWCGFTLSALGAAVMTLAPFFGAAAPVMSNYVPVLDDARFLFGLALFGAGLALTTLRALAVPGRVGLALPGAGVLRFGLNAAAVATALALGALLWSALALRHGAAAGLVGKPYYELLFWGAGHVVQFTWTLLMLVGWLWLATRIEAPLPLSPRVVLLLFGVALVSVFATPLIYLAFDVGSVEQQRLFTWLMRFGGGLAIVPIVLALAVALWRAPPRAPDGRAPGGAADARALRACLLASMALFCVGGVIGFLIRGSDVRVPAHYHGAIVGVTLALMGVTYALLPALGFARPGAIARWQPLLYGAGQLMHIVGLVWSGGYGVQRKVAGAGQVLRTPQEVAGMGLMGLGGLVAIIGGLLFVVVVLQSVQRARRARAAAR